MLPVYGSLCSKLLKIGVQQRSLSHAGCVVPAARYSACESAWHRWEQPVVTVWGLVPDAAMVPVFLAL